MVDLESLITVLVIGLVAGWLAHLIMGGGGLMRDLVSGLLGAVVGSVLVYGFGVPLPFASPLFSDIVISTIGAVAVIVVARLIAWRSRTKMGVL